MNISILIGSIIGKYWSNYKLDIFKERHWELTEIISNDTDYNNVFGQFDAIIVGSDQIWNSACIETMGLHYFGINADTAKQRLIAYAPSFGKNRFETKASNIERLRVHISKFKAISVRENDGIDLLNRYFQYEHAVRVLDPTMLMNLEYYLKIAGIKEIKEQNTLAYYFLDDNKEKQDYIKRLSKLTGLKPKNIGKDANSTSANPFAKLRNLRYPSVESWLKNIAECKMIVTDSFHGTVFSIIFNKEFLTFRNADRGNSRFDNLLSMFNLEDRLIHPDMSEFEIPATIDYDKVNQKMTHYQKLSREFLDKSLE